MSHAENTCLFLAKEYDVVPGKSWGSLSDKSLRQWWSGNGCGEIVSKATALNAGLPSGAATDTNIVPLTQPSHTHVYLDSWGGLQRPDLLKHADRVLYAFWGLADDGTVTGRDMSIERKLTGSRVSAALGGWGNCANFSRLFSSADSRAAVIRSLLDSCRTAGFDGVDVDWEYPSGASDPQNLLNLLKELRAAAPAGFQLSVAASANPRDYYSGIASGLSAVLDAVHVMTYDFVGPWDNTAGFNSSLPDAQTAIAAYAAIGFPASKLFAGSAFYGREATVNSVTLNYGIGQRSVAWKDLQYSEIASTRLGQPGWTRIW